MKKKFFSKLLMVALVATVGVFSSCKDYDDDIADVRNNLSQTATELRTDYTNKINAVNTKIETLQTSYDKLSKALDESNAQLQTLINTKFEAAVNEAKAYSDANLVKAKDAAAAAEAAAKAYAETQAAAAQSAAIAAAKEQVAAAKAELEAALAKANELIATQGQSIANLIEADKTLDAAIKAAQARADEAYALADKANTLAETNKTNVEKAAADIAALQKSLSALESKAADKADVAKLQSDLAALQKQVGETVVNLADYKESIANITSELAKLKSDLEQQVSFLGENLAGVKKTAEANAASIESIITQLSELKKANDLAHQELANSVDALAKKTSSDLAAAVQGIEAEIAAANKLIGDNTSAIASLTQTVQNNKDAQDKINEAIKGDVAQNAKDIAANSKEIKRLNEIIPELQSTLEKYADKVAGAAAQAGKDAAAAAEATAKQFALDAIAAQALLDKEAWNKAIDIAVETLVKTYKLNALDGIIKAAAAEAQTNAEANAAKKAQEISDEALKQAKLYTDVLAQTLADNYTTTKDMQAAIEAAKQSAVAQAYVKVLEDLLRDQPDWYNQNAEDKLLQPSPTIYEVAMKCVQEFGLSKENAEELMNSILDAALVPSKGTGTYDAEGNEIIEKGGKIMVLIEAAAEKAAQDLAAVNEALDARLADIEAFLATTSGEKTLDATIKYWIADAKLAKQADLDDVIAQLKGEKDGDLKKIITDLQAADAANAADVDKIMASINKVTGMFAALLPAAEGDIDKDLAAYEAVMQALADKILAMADVVDNLDDKVMEAVNKNLGPQIQTMITSINLFANQHMAERDEQYKLAQFDGEKWIYPFGYDNFDHTLTFMYTVESGLYSDYCGDPTLSEESWNYPSGLIKQLKGISSVRDQQYPYDYDFSYDEGGFTGSASDFDFVDGRYRSYDDSILVRVSPTNADLSKAEIALLNSKGEDIIDAGLVELVDVKPYTRNSYIVRNAEYSPVDQRQYTRAAEGNATGLWVIKFKLNEAQVASLWNKYAYAKTTKDNKEQLTGNILYAVAVKNTDFSTEETADVDRFVVSEYDLDLGTAEPEHAWEFFVNQESIDDIHNRYIMSEEAPNGETAWTDDPENYTSTFRYELTWHGINCDDEEEQPGEDPETPVVVDNTHPAYYTYCWHCWCLPGGEIDDNCEDKDYGYKHPAWSSILFKGDMDNYTDVEQKGVNTCDRHGHTFADDGKRQMNGIDNRHMKEFLPIEFNYEMDGAMWAKIDIEFPAVNNCGVPTPIRGFFVTLDNHFAIESQNSEINAWAQYIYKNVAAYNYDHHKKKTEASDETDAVIDRKIVLQPGNKGTIYIKDAANILNDEIVGFRVHAVNLDGTLVDPDGRAFYVKIGKKTTNHKLSFNITADTQESYAVQNADENGENPIAAYNDLMKSEGSSDRFFNQPAYNSSFVDSRIYKVVYTWREGNPLIRGQKDFTTAWQPIAGTGNDQEFDLAGDIVTKAVAYSAARQEYEKTGIFAPENFFDFWYSENPAADIEDNKDNSWKQFATEDDPNTEEEEFETPNQKTMSMRAAIKAGVANRLIDGETYKIRMTILRNDAQTVWSIVNTYDIDITKDMPTDLPSKFYVKDGQLKNGAWKVYVRPYAGIDFASADEEGDDAGNDPAPEGETDPWAITWGDYGVTATPNNFASIFDADEYTDANDTKQPTNLHNYRWAMDVRMYNLEGIFNGLYIDEIGNDGKPTGNQTIDQDYYFIFKQSGSFTAAEEAIKKGTAAEKADAAAKDLDAMATFDTDYDLSKVNQGSANADLTHEKGAYTIPLIHWSHLGQKKDVYGGYIYRDISATLNADGTAFLKPSQEKTGKKGLAITNDDYEIEAVPLKLGVKRDGAQVKAEYVCAFKDAISFADNTKQYKLGADGKTVGFDYNEDVIVPATEAKFKLASVLWYNAGGDYAKQQAYFNTQFNANWTADTKVNNKTVEGVAGTLADWLKTPWCWLDLASLNFKATAPKDFRTQDYYKAPTFTVQGKPFDPEKNELSDIDGIGMERMARNEGLPDFKDNITGEFTFDIYDIWFHKKQVKLFIKVNKPENTTSRQAR